MNNFSPDQLYDSIQARHQDIRNVEAARQAAKLAQSNQSNPLQRFATNILSMIKDVHSQTDTQITASQPSFRNTEA